MIEDITLFKQHCDGKGYRLVKRKNENGKTENYYIGIGLIIYMLYDIEDDNLYCNDDRISWKPDFMTLYFHLVKKGIPESIIEKFIKLINKSREKNANKL